MTRRGGNDFPAVAGLAAAGAAYRAHVACSVALRHAVQLGHRASELLEARTAPSGFKPAFRRALARQPPFLTGAAKLRYALDCVLCADVDRRQEHVLREDLGVPGPRVVEVYFGWNPRGGQRDGHDDDDAIAAAAGGRRRLRMAHVTRVRCFVAAMWTALARARDLDRTTRLQPEDARTQLLHHLVARHARALEALEDRVRHAAAEHIQAAWRRAWYQPGMGVWRRRMLREFDEMASA